MLHTSPWTSDAPHQSMDAKKIAWGGDKVTQNTRTLQLLERIGLRADSSKNCSMQTILMSIVGELAEIGSMAVAVGVSDM